MREGRGGIIFQENEHSFIYTSEVVGYELSTVFLLVSQIIFIEFKMSFMN